MPDPSCSAEIVIVGAGPAGCAAAIRLAQLGHEVLLIERGGPGRPAALESAPAVLLPLLQSLGLGAALQAAGFSRPGAAALQWAGPMQVVPEPEPGYLLERQRFDALLREGARAAGVRWLARAAARFPQAHGTGDAAHWQLALHDGRVLRARGVLWATGRSGAPSPGGPLNAGLVGCWRLAAAPGPGLDGSDGMAVRVQAGREGWAWSARGRDGDATVALFIDAQRLRGLATAGREVLYRRSLSEFTLISPPLAGATLTRLRVADATPRAQAPAIGPGAWRIGEAAHSLDPLSAQGVVSALRSGVQAAVAMHTWRLRPESAWLASNFLHEQQLRELQRHRRWRLAFHAEAARAWAAPFWQQRSEPVTGEAPDLGGAGEASSLGEADKAPSRGETGAAARPLPALDRTVRLEARARLAPAAVLDGDWIASAPVLSHPQLAGPLAQVGGVPVVQLLQVLVAPVGVGRVLRAWADLIGPAGATELFQRWWWLGVLTDADAGPGAVGAPEPVGTSGTSRTLAAEVSMAAAGTRTP